MTSPNSRRFGQIGLDRLVRLDWLEKTATLVLAGNDVNTTKAVLREDLRDSFPRARTTVRGSLDKTITILTRVWRSSPGEMDSLRARGLKLLRTLPQDDHVAIHWGMTMAVYPFWAAVATQVGRLLTLQGTAATTQVQRRVKEQYGERETVSRRVRYVLRSYIDWGVLSETDAKGVYRTSQAQVIENPRVVAWLVETYLHTRESACSPIRDVLQSPAFFPFRLLPVPPGALQSASANLGIVRSGPDDILVMLLRRGRVNVDRTEER